MDRLAEQAISPEAPTAPVFEAGGNRSEQQLPAAVFDVAVNPALLHAVVRAQLAGARSGTQSTKTRAEVRGGGARPWRQKGTGRARHGSIREPQWVGGGVSHGPKPRDYGMRINKKEKALALGSALTVRSREGAVRVVELPHFERPQTRRALELLRSWEARGRILLVLGSQRPPDEVYKSFRNLSQVVTVSHPTTYQVLAADTVLLTRSALQALRPAVSSQRPDAPEEAQNQEAR